jgi:F-type H+-transporting ATPase subunit alpha
MAVEHQVAIIYAVTNGALDDVDIKNIRQWERDFLRFVEAQHGGIYEGIRTKKQLDNDIKAKLDQAIKVFKPMFKPE